MAAPPLPGLPAPPAAPPTPPVAPPLPPAPPKLPAPPTAMLLEMVTLVKFGAAPPLAVTVKMPPP